MPRVYELIDRANSLICACQFENARRILDEALCLDPNNLVVWETYLQTFTTRDGLEQAKARVLGTKELSVPDEFGIFSGRYYLIRCIDSKLRALIP